MPLEIIAVYADLYDAGQKQDQGPRTDGGTRHIKQA